jgi:hypothetical protein
LWKYHLRAEVSPRKRRFLLCNVRAAQQAEASEDRPGQNWYASFDDKPFEAYSCHVAEVFFWRRCVMPYKSKVDMPQWIELTHKVYETHKKYPDLQQALLARRFGISQQTVSRIIKQGPLPRQNEQSN